MTTVRMLCSPLRSTSSASSMVRFSHHLLLALQSTIFCAKKCLVVVVGHTGCGGVEACLNAARAGSNTEITAVPTTPMDRWLGPLTALARSMVQQSTWEEDSEKPRDEAVLSRKVAEANVRAQVANVCSAKPVVRAWTTGDSSGRQLWVHGWLYEVENGMLKDLDVSKGTV
jgi:carbonic anhydrase